MNTLTNTLLDKNIMFLQDKLPQMYDMYKKLENECNDDKEVENIITSGYNNLTINNKPVHSIYDMTMDSKIMCEIISGDEFDTIFIFGMGVGYHIEEICDRYPDKNKVFYEPNFKAFRELMKTQNLESLYKKNVVFILSDSKQNVLESLIGLFSTLAVYRITFIGLPTYIEEYNDDWTYLIKGYVDYFSRYTVNVKTLFKYNNLWMLNFFKNLKHYPFESEFDDFKGKFEGVPGIIVSSGPSLKKNMHLLNDLLDKAIIVSAGSSINALEANSIKPHVMLAVDGTQLMSDEYNAVKDDTAIFAHILNVHYDCIEKYKGPKLNFKVSGEPHMEYFEDKISNKTTIVNTGGSCANVAMDFLVKLGCNPIILIGQDLCFTGNVTHSEGVWDRQDITERVKSGSSELIKTKDINGEDVYTNPVFNSIHKWFEDYIRNSDRAEKGVKFVNATEGGLKIEGAEHIPFADAINIYCNKEKNIREKLKELHSKSLFKAMESKDKLKDFLGHIEKEMKKLEKVSKSRLEVLEKIQKRLGDITLSNEEHKKEMEKLTKRLEKNEAFKYFVWFSCFEIVYNMKNYYEKLAEGKSDVNEKLKVLYEGLEKQYGEIHLRIKIIKEFANEALKEIETLKDWKDANGQLCG